MPSQLQISVIIPTFNRIDSLASCLDRLAPGTQALEFNHYEVIVSDDSRLATLQESFKNRYAWVKWLEGPGRGPAANRNFGAKEAKGEWLAFVDDDCLPDRSWLAAILRASEKEPLAVIEGKTIALDKEDNPLKRVVENLKGGCFWSCNLAVRRSAFFKLGGFDEDYLDAAGEDVEFAYRMHKHQMRCDFVEEAVVYHPQVCLTFEKLLLQTFGGWRWWLLTAHKTEVLSFSHGLPKLLILAAGHHVVNQLRLTWHLFKRHDPSLWRTNLFYRLWGWLMLPFTIPYVMYWGFRFKRQESKRLVQASHFRPSAGNCHRM